MVDEVKYSQAQLRSGAYSYQQRQIAKGQAIQQQNQLNAQNLQAYNQQVAQTEKQYNEFKKQKEQAQQQIDEVENWYKTTLDKLGAEGTLTGALNRQIYYEYKSRLENPKAELAGAEKGIELLNSGYIPSEVKSYANQYSSSVLSNLEQGSVQSSQTIKESKQTGGYYYNAQTGQGISIMQGGKVPVGYVQTATISEIRGGNLISKPRIQGEPIFGGETIKQFEFKEQSPGGYVTTDKFGQGVSKQNLNSDNIFNTNDNYNKDVSNINSNFANMGSYGNNTQEVSKTTAFQDIKEKGIKYVPFFVSAMGASIKDYGKSLWSGSLKEAKLRNEETKRGLRVEDISKRYLDPDIRNLYITSGAIAATPAAGIWVGRTILGYQSYQVIKNPSTENFANLGLLSIPILGEKFIGRTGVKSSELKFFEKAPTIIKGVRIEGEGGGLDILYGMKKTPSTTYLTKINQPFYNVGENKFTLEGGKGISYALDKSGNMKVTSFETGGQGYISPNVPKINQEIITKGKETGNGLLDDLIGIKQQKELTEYQGGYGRVYTKEKLTGNFKINKGIDFPSGNFRVTAQGKINPSAKYDVGSFFGLGKEAEGSNVIDVFGGKASKARLYPEGRISVLGKPEYAGKIKRVSFGDLGLTDVQGGGTILTKTKTKLSSPIYAQDLIEKGMRTTLTKPSPKTNLLRTPSITIPIMSEVTATKQKPISYLTTESITKARQKDIGSLLFANQGVKNKETILPSSALVQLPRQEEVFLPATKQISRPIQKNRTKLINLTKEEIALDTSQKYKQLFKIQTKQAERYSQKPKTALITRLNMKLGIPILIPNLTSNIERKKEKRDSILREAFNVLVRRKGRYEKIAKGLPLGKAKALGTKRVTGTLAQTFKLEEAGTTSMEDINFEVPSNIFTKLKRPTSNLEFVERRGQTLKRYTGEVPEILQAKKIKYKKTKWL